MDNAQPTAWIRLNRSAHPLRLTVTAALLAGMRLAEAQNAYLQHNLVSDLPNLADNIDTNLTNPWGIAASATSPFWLSDNHSGFSTLYNTAGVPSALKVQIPSPSGQGPGAPTGIIFNSNSQSFLLNTNQPARFIFATEDGTIAGWNAGTNAVIKADNSGANAIYKGLALGSLGGSNFLYAADFHNGKIDIFDSTFQPVVLDGAFADTNLPAGYAPFNIQNLNGSLYVTYALQDDEKEDDSAGPGHGFINVFDPAGKLVQRFATNGPLNSPWGLALAPAGFGEFSQALLVGNFGDGQINAFDTSGSLLGHLNDTNGAALAIPGLWGIKFGNGGQGGDPSKLYFAAGIPGSGALEDHGLFGSISVASTVSLAASSESATTAVLSWTGGTPPFLIQRKLAVTDTNWFDVVTTTNQSAIVAKDEAFAFYRILDHAPTNVTAFTVWMSGGSEVPALTNTATGYGIMSLKGQTLSYHIRFSNLSGPAVAAHIHGPADTATSTGVLVPLIFPSAPEGVLAGTIDVSTLKPEDLVSIKSGKTYVNIHTGANPSGEMRGQLAPMKYGGLLNGANEVPVTTSTGTGQADVTLVGNRLYWNVTYTGLSSSASAAHIHGPAAATAAAPVLFPIGTPAGTSGTLSGSQTLSQTQLNELLDGLTYVNVHTTQNPGGEIRVQLTPQ